MRKPLEGPFHNRTEPDVAVGEGPATRRSDNLPRLGDRLQAIGHDQRWTVKLVRAAEIYRSRAGNYLAGMNTDANRHPRIVELSDATDQIQRCQARHDGMKVVGGRCTEYGKEVRLRLPGGNHFATTMNSSPHFVDAVEVIDRLFEFEIDNQVGRPAVPRACKIVTTLRSVWSVSIPPPLRTPGPRRAPLPFPEAADRCRRESLPELCLRTPDRIRPHS